MGHYAEIEVRRRIDLHSPDRDRAIREAENRMVELRDSEDVDRAIVIDVFETDSDDGGDE